jgi:predicted transcriptional regulator
MYMPEKELALLSFPKRDNRFDFFGYSSTDEDTLRWCRELFGYYWEKGKPFTYD